MQIFVGQKCQNPSELGNFFPVYRFPGGVKFVLFIRGTSAGWQNDRHGHTLIYRYERASSYAKKLSNEFK